MGRSGALQWLDRGQGGQADFLIHSFHLAPA